jgi:hypothetical protein
MTGPTEVAPDRDTFIGWIADHFQARHSPPLGREEAVAMGKTCLEYSEEDAPFGHPDYAWDKDGAVQIAQDEIDSTWEFEA